MLRKVIATITDPENTAGLKQIRFLAQDIGEVAATANNLFIVSTYTNTIYRSGVSFDLAQKYGPAIYDNYLSLGGQDRFGSIAFVPGTDTFPNIIYTRTVPLNNNELLHLPEAIASALEKTFTLVQKEPGLRQIIIPLLGSSVTSGLALEDSLKIILRTIMAHREKLADKEFLILLRRSRQHFLAKAEEILKSQDFSIAQREKDVLIETISTETDLRQMITRYQIADRTSYIKDALSILVEQNTNSTVLTSGLGINWHASDRTQRKPLFFKKINFRQLLTTEIRLDKNNYQLKLIPSIRKTINETVLHVRQLIYRNGQEVENTAEYAQVYPLLLKKLTDDIAELNIDISVIQENIKTFVPYNFKNAIARIPNIDKAMQQKLERFALAHQLIQDAFIKKIRSYIQQVSDSQLELPELVIIAIALEACLNELLTGNAPATRMIENITYIADRFFAQNITPEKLDFFPQNNDPRPLALLAEYFTLEDTLEIFQELPEKANLAFISAWEPDFISQEKKRKDRQLRNDDTQELCELFGFGFYISDDTISNFNKLSEQLPDTLCILDGETFKTFKNEQWHYFSETFFIMNQPAELERFIDTYNEIFSFSRDPSIFWKQIIFMRETCYSLNSIISSIDDCSLILIT